MKQLYLIIASGARANIAGRKKTEDGTLVLKQLVVSSDCNFFYQLSVSEETPRLKNCLKMLWNLCPLLHVIIDSRSEKA